MAKLACDSGNESIMQNLLDAGCDAQFADTFFREDSQSQLKLLSCHRCRLLDTIHAHQKQLDCLDYLIYSIKRRD